MKVKKTIIKCAAAAALALLGVQGAAAGNIVYSLGDNTTQYGTGGKNAETYDVGIRISDPNLKGVSIKGVRIAFPFANGLSNAKAWLTKQLPEIKSSKAGEFDILTQSFTIAEGYTEVLFSKPYTLTDEGVYVGYSFDVEKVETALYPVWTGKYTSPDGFYIHTTKIYRTAWRSLYGQAGDLTIQVLLEGDKIYTNAATVGEIEEANVETGKESTTTFQLVNYGSNGIQSFDYTLSIDGKNISKHVDLDEAVPAVYGQTVGITAQLPALPKKGAYPLTIVISKVNGVSNKQPNAFGQGVVNVYNTLPTHRAVVEEYTGTWCGYCPRGYVGLEEMNRLYPNDFIALSYHNADPMEVFTVNEFPWNPAVLGEFPGYPSAAIDRIMQTDAFSGNSQYGTFGIDKAWLERNKVFAPAEVEVRTKWDSSNSNVLVATAEVTFPVERADNPYELGFVLTSDGLTGTASEWRQANYYSGEAGWPSSMDMFVEGGSKVADLVFNDVVVARSGAAGIEGSVKSPIKADETQSYEYKFDISTLKPDLVADKSKLRVNVLLINKQTGEIVNANKAWAGKSSTDGISNLAAGENASVVGVSFYDLQGRRIQSPRSGIFFRQERLANGQMKVQKVVVR